MIHYGRQSISEEDIAAVIEVLRSDLITQGPMVTNFEKSMCDYTGAGHAVACSSGTAALHMACLSLDVGTGDTVWTTPNSFIASANCALYCGAEVDFVDIDPQTLNISIPSLREKLHAAQVQGRLPKALVVVHFAGSPCDMMAVKLLADHYRIAVIEDASHALGASYQGQKIGSCQYSDMTVISFHPVKSITTGEGGMLLSHDSELIEKARLFANQGLVRSSSGMLKDQAEPWYYEQQVLGFNYRLTDIQAALGVSQLSRLDKFVKARQALASNYTAHLVASNLGLQRILPEAESAHHLFVVQLPEKLAPLKRSFYEQMKQNGVLLNCHYIPIHWQPVYKKKGFKEGDFPNAENYYQRTFSLPIYPDLSVENQSKVIDSVLACVKALA